MNKGLVCINKVLKINYQKQIIEIGIANIQIKLVAILENGCSKTFMLSFYYKQKIQMVPHLIFLYLLWLSIC